MLDRKSATSTEVKQYEIRDRIIIHKLPLASPTFLNFWCPIIPDLPYQRVTDLQVDLYHSYNLIHEKEHGNFMLYSHVEGPLPREIHLELRYHVERLPLLYSLESERVGEIRSRLLFSRHLSFERHVDESPRVKELAELIVGDRANILEKARRLYDYVLENGTQSSEDVHALFVSLCRSLNIPARFVVGEELDTFSEEESDSISSGYHAWAEFFAPGIGWLPVDASYSCKYKKSYLFGNLPSNHIAWSVGRDILLQPPQTGGRLLFFMAPYAEVAGNVHRHVFRKITSRELSFSQTFSNA